MFPKNKLLINKEIYSSMGNNTWKLVVLPSGCKPIGCNGLLRKNENKYRNSLILSDGCNPKLVAMIAQTKKAKQMIDSSAVRLEQSMPAAMPEPAKGAA